MCVCVCYSWDSDMWRESWPYTDHLLSHTYTLSLSLSFHLSLCLLLPLTLFCHSLQWFLKEAPDVDISRLLCEQIGSGFKRTLSPPFQFTLPDRCSSPPSLSLSLSLICNQSTYFALRHERDLEFSHSRPHYLAWQLINKCSEVYSVRGEGDGEESLDLVRRQLISDGFLRMIFTLLGKGVLIAIPDVRTLI